VIDEGKEGGKEEEEIVEPKEKKSKEQGNCYEIDECNDSIEI
jgi:hypothetical protein